MPKVSVVMPLYNVENYLRQSLDSIINQTLKDIEIICVNDGSTDNTLNILNEYKEKDNRITVINQLNLHCGVARNTGLKVATGEYITFLDGDDFFELTMLEEMYNQVKKDNSDIIICGDYIYNEYKKRIDKTILIDDVFVKNSPFSPLDFKDTLFQMCGPITWNKLIKLSLFKQYNLLFEDTICCTDLTCICLAMTLAKKISILNKPFIYYRLKQSNNLTAYRNKDTSGLFISAQRLKNKLENFNLYSTFKKSFIKRIKRSIAWELSISTKEQKLERTILAEKILSPDLYFDLYEKNKNNINVIFKQNTNINIKISIVIPVYNTAKYLKQCLDSIINQTLKDIEIICVDDGSTDNSLNILNEYKEKDNRIKVLIQKNSYAGVARNTGLKVATGEYIIFLDSDDFFEPTMLEEMYNQVKKDNSDIIICKYYCYSNVTKKDYRCSSLPQKIINLSPFSPDVLKKTIFTFCSMNPWAKLIKRSLFIDNNILFNDTICSNDFAGICLALVCAKKISILNKPFIHYRVALKTSTTTKRNINFNGFISDIKALDYLRKNLIRLNKYAYYRYAFLARAKNILKDKKDIIYKNLAKESISNEFYELFYG